MIKNYELEMAREILVYAFFVVCQIALFVTLLVLFATQ